MSQRPWLLALALTAAPLAPAAAASFISVEARWDGNPSQYAELSGSPIVSGIAIDKEGFGSASTANGLPACNFAPCGLAVPASGLALARAEANGTAGVLKGRTFVVDNPPGDTAFIRAESLARLEDTISFTGPTAVFDFDIDLDWALDGEEAGTVLVFRFGVLGSGCPVIAPECLGGGDQVLREFIASADIFEGGPTDQFYVLLGPDNPFGNPREELATGTTLPGSFQFSYDYTPLLNPPVFPGFPPPGDPSFFWELSTFSRIEGAGAALMAADNSVYIGLENYVSANGYTYDGRPANGPGPGPGPIPEPSTWALLIGGFAAIGAALRARRPKPIAAL